MQREMGFVELDHHCRLLDIGESEVLALTQGLQVHPLYPAVQDIESLRIFMQSHVYAVWDFMSLLKALQARLTCLTIPWTPNFASKKLARLINEIVMGEESDLGMDGEPTDHFSMYLEAMGEVGACTGSILKTMEQIQALGPKCELSAILEVCKSNLTRAQYNFVSYHLNLAFHGQAHEIAASFFYGREKIIPLMFTSIVQVLRRHQMDCPRMIYYLERHIELDGDEHSLMAGDCLNLLCGQDEQKWLASSRVASQSLRLRSELWDEVYFTIMGRHQV